MTKILALRALLTKILALRALLTLLPCTLLPCFPAPCFPCFPCFPASLLPLLPLLPCFLPVARLAVLSPEARSARCGVYPGWGTLWYAPCTPLGMPPGHTQGCTWCRPPGTPPRVHPAPRRNGPLGSTGLAGSGPAGLPAGFAVLITVSSVVLARSSEPAKGGFCKWLDSIQVQAGLGRPGCTGLGGVVVKVRKPADSAGRTDGRDETGRTERDGTELTSGAAWLMERRRKVQLAAPTTGCPSKAVNRLKPVHTLSNTTWFG